MSGLAGEFFVAAELLKRGYQTSLTLGNAKSTDLFAQCPVSGSVIPVQVKALSDRNWFILRRDAVRRDHVYVFVILNKPGAATQYFVVPGDELINNDELFLKGFSDPKMPGIYWKSLQQFEDLWVVFERIQQTTR